jgi:hypothetical protein
MFVKCADVKNAEFDTDSESVEKDAKQVINEKVIEKWSF